MLKTKMYVRCPADQENIYEPRVFVCGQIINIDEFKRTVSVKVHDPFGHLLFFEDLPKGIIELPLGSVDRCSFFIGSIVVYKGSSYKVLSCQKCKDDYYKYYIQNFDDKSVVKVPEAEAIAAFNNGQVDPCVQLKKCEFQNPAWYLGRAVVAKSMDILENSIYGFKELAGSKIYLMPHQVNTIMRCLQESPCRYMLATLKHKFLRANGVFKEIEDKVISLRTSIDVMIYDDAVYMFTLAGEKLFDLERSYRATCSQKIEEIGNSNILNDIDSFSLIAGKGHNPRKFVSFNDSHFQKLKNANSRRKMAEKFKIPLDGDKFDTTQDGAVDKIVKLLCDRAMVDPFDEYPMEVAGSKKWE